jgi:hypothetical protein
MLPILRYSKLDSIISFKKGDRHHPNFVAGCACHRINLHKPLHTMKIVREVFSVYDEENYYYEDSLGAFRGLLFGLVLGTAIWVMFIAAFIWYIH